MKVKDETILHFLWKNRLFRSLELLTTDNKSVEVLHPGMTNNDAGPDFQNARLKIDGQLWAGNVEIHIRASDWYRHKHHMNPAYQNVILHVVFEADIQHDSDMSPPVLELSQYVEDKILQNAENLLISHSELPCYPQIMSVEDQSKTGMVARAAVERIERKHLEKQDLLQLTGYDFQRWLMVELFASFGLKANTQPMQSLAQKISGYTFVRSSTDRHAIEALLYGVASLLPPEPVDEYSALLNREYDYLKHKYGIENVLEPHIWKFHRIHPVSFPTIRISQLAALLMRWDEFVSKIFKHPDLDRLKELLKVEASEYWSTHYRFGISANKSMKKRTGEDLINRILINTVIPVMVSYSKSSDNTFLHNTAIEWLERLPAEHNSITRQMKTHGFNNANALESQGLIHLKNFYCLKKKCLFCSIGYKIIKS